MNLPEWLPEDAWREYLMMRKLIRKPMTERAKELAIRKLQGLKEEGSDPREVLEQSIFNSWQGLFEVHVGASGYVGKKERDLQVELTVGKGPELKRRTVQ
jgi:hypothetical protein